MATQWFAIVSLAAACCASGLINRKATTVLTKTMIGAPDGSEAIRTLDSNHDGQVTLDDVAVFARKKGLDYASTLTEFAGLDGDRNGQLDATELADVLGAADAPAVEAAPAVGTPIALAAIAPMVPAQERWSVAGAAAPAQAAPRVAPAVPAEVMEASLFASANDRVPLQPVAEEASPQLDRDNSTLSSISEGLQVSAAKEQEAQAFDQEASELRAEARKLIFDASQRARAESMTASKNKATEFFKEITGMEEKAMVMEVKAAAMRAKADAELREVSDIMSVAEDGLKR